MSHNQPGYYADLVQDLKSRPPHHEVGEGTRLRAQRRFSEDSEQRSIQDFVAYARASTTMDDVCSWS